MIREAAITAGGSVAERALRPITRHADVSFEQKRRDGNRNAHRRCPVENRSTTIYNASKVPQNNPKLHLRYTRNVSCHL